MPRNACTRHPRRDVIEIPEGSRYCKRCHHLVPPVKEMPLEEEIEKLEAKVERLKTIKEQTETPLEAELTEEIEAVEEAVETAVEPEIEATVPEEREPKETVVEAEPEIVDVIQPVIIELPEKPLEAEPEAIKETPEEISKKAHIAALKAKLAKLEKTE